MKIDLIGMILAHAGQECFDGVIIDDNGKELDAAHSLDHMILEYAKVRQGGESSTVAVSRHVAVDGLVASRAESGNEDHRGIHNRKDRGVQRGYCGT